MIYWDDDTRPPVYSGVAGEDEIVHERDGLDDLVTYHPDAEHRVLSVTRHFYETALVAMDLVEIVDGWTGTIGRTTEPGRPVVCLKFFWPTAAPEHERRAYGSSAREAGQAAKRLLALLQTEQAPVARDRAA